MTRSSRSAACRAAPTSRRPSCSPSRRSTGSHPRRYRPLTSRRCWPPASLRWGDLERGVGWANFFVIGASISLAHALDTSGAAPWLGRVLVGGLPGLSRTAIGTIVFLLLGATLVRALVPNISAFLALALPIAMSVGREAGLNPVVCALAGMMTGDAVVYSPAQSSSALIIYERGHVSAGEIFRFGLWMTLLGWVTVLVVALPWWSLVGEPLTGP